VPSMSFDDPAGKGRDSANTSFPILPSTNPSPNHAQTPAFNPTQHQHLSQTQSKLHIAQLTPYGGEEPIYYPLNLDDQSFNTDKSLPPTPFYDPPHSNMTSHGNGNGPPSLGTQFEPLPEAPPSKTYGQGYSAFNPVPTVSHYKEVHAQHEEQAKRYQETVEARQREAEQRDKQGNVDGNRSSGRGGSNGDVEEVKVEGNAVKNTLERKGENVSANKGTSEKARLMDQMNANQREYSSGSSWS
jgi:hypothetical protein